MAVEFPHITLFARNVLELPFQLFESDVAGAAPLDLTPYTVRWSLSEAPVGVPDWSDTAVLQKTSPAGGVVITDAAQGKGVVRVTSSETSELLRRYRQELEVVDAFGEAEVVGGGFLTFKRNIRNT